MQVAYMPSENVLPRTRVPRSPTAPQRFNRTYTVSLAERGCPDIKKEGGERMGQWDKKLQSYKVTHLCRLVLYPLYII